MPFVIKSEHIWEKACFTFCTKSQKLKLRISNISHYYFYFASINNKF